MGDRSKNYPPWMEPRQGGVTLNPSEHWRVALMQQLTPQGLQKINELAQRHSVSPDAVMTLLHALVNGHGMMAQFEHGELGGKGQWMRGGMVMVGDMFTHALKAEVDGLCSA